MAKASGGKPRHFSADEKLKVLEEARAPGTTMAEVLRRYQLKGATFYRWEREAKAAMRDALGGKARGDARVRELERENERLRVELETKRRAISDVVEENLARKGGSEGARTDAVRGRGEARTPHAGRAYAGAHRVDAPAHPAPAGAFESPLRVVDEARGRRRA